MTTNFLPFTVTDAKQLRAGETAYSAAGTGDVVTVRIVRVPSENPQFTVLELSGRLIEPSGTSRLIGGKPVEFPAHRRSVHLAAVAPPPHGNTTPEKILAELLALALSHWPAYLASLTAFEALPLLEITAPSA